MARGRGRFEVPFLFRFFFLHFLFFPSRFLLNRPPTVAFWQYRPVAAGPRTGQLPDWTFLKQLLQNIVKTNELSFPLGYNLSYDCMDLCQKLLRRNAVVDSLEFVDQDYVLVPGPPLDMSSSSVSPSRPSNSPFKSESSPIISPNFSASSAPMPITGAAVGNVHALRNLESCGSPASGTSHGSMDMADVSEQSPAHFMMRIRSLQQFASVIKDVVKEKVKFVF
ncbi:hypothetical protein B296_00045444 [Ensete ventricosum]|uniref:ATG1a/b/c MIT domain-containing protein n=1 Tax=Ensete ventricosum TaxID=4639 RepID=A0A426YW25_ENSVE|nr:hypothetical protein B296_00045444 [Ensete ventricosum]